MSLKEIQAECHQTSVDHGWWEGVELDPTVIAMKLCLIHSEVSEALEEVRKNDGSLYYTEEVTLDGVKTRRIVPESELGSYKLGSLKPEGFPSELADVLIRVFDLAGKMNIDLESVTREKMAYNKTRPHKHGGKAI